MIHLIWIGEPTPEVEAAKAAWGKYAPATLWTELPPEFEKEMADTLETAPNVQSVADLLRYWILREHGGIYADCDALPLKDPAPLLKMPCFCAGIRFVEHYRFFSNYFIGAAEPGHQVWVNTVERCKTAPLGPDYAPFHFSYLWDQSAPCDMVPPICDNSQVKGDEWVRHTSTWRPKKTEPVPYPGKLPEQRIITEAEAQERLEICNKCKYIMHNGLCKKCGCCGRNQSRLASVHCPINKW